MERSPEELKIEQEAIQYIKDNQKVIQRHFADPERFPSVEKPVSIFMAGSPGAGKTEFSKRFITDSGKPVVRIDPDAIRDMLPQYDHNATLMQKAAALGVEKVYDFAIRHNQDLILDGTLNDYDKASSNIQRSLKHGRIVQIYYIYQDPIIAWEFTKKREVIEHRGIPKDFFIYSFFKSQENVNKLKEEFGSAIEINLIMKNFENDDDKLKLNIDRIDSYLKMSYTKDTLEIILI